MSNQIGDYCQFLKDNPIILEALEAIYKQYPDCEYTLSYSHSKKTPFVNFKEVEVLYFKPLTLYKENQPSGRVVDHFVARKNIYLAYLSAFLRMYYIHYLNHNFYIAELLKIAQKFPDKFDITNNNMTDNSEIIFKALQQLGLNTPVNIDLQLLWNKRFNCISTHFKDNKKVYNYCLKKLDYNKLLKKFIKEYKNEIQAKF